MGHSNSFLVSSSCSGRNPFQWKILRCFVACQEDLSIPWFTKSITSWTCPLLWSLRKLASQWHQLQTWRSTPLYILLGLIERGAYKLPAAKHSRYRLSLRAWSCVSLVYVYWLYIAFFPYNLFSRWTKNWSWGRLWKGLRWRLYSKSCHDGHLKDILVIMQYCKFIFIVFELCIYICMIMHVCIRQTHTHTSCPHLFLRYFEGSEKLSVKSNRTILPEGLDARWISMLDSNTFLCCGRVAHAGWQWNGMHAK